MQHTPDVPCCVEPAYRMGCHTGTLHGSLSARQYKERYQYTRMATIDPVAMRTCVYRMMYRKQLASLLPMGRNCRVQLKFDNVCQYAIAFVKICQHDCADATL